MAQTLAVEKPTTLDIILAFMPIPKIGERKALHYILGYHLIGEQRLCELTTNSQLIDEGEIHRAAMIDTIAIRALVYGSTAGILYAAVNYIF